MSIYKVIYTHTHTHTIYIYIYIHIYIYGDTIYKLTGLYFQSVLGGKFRICTSSGHLSRTCQGRCQAAYQIMKVTFLFFARASGPMSASLRNAFFQKRSGSYSLPHLLLSSLTKHICPGLQPVIVAQWAESSLLSDTIQKGNRLDFHPAQDVQA